MTLRKSLLFAPLALAVACAPHGSTCIVGQSASCTCTNGKSGAQVCQGDGTFAECSCTGTGTDTPSGGGDGGSTLNPDLGTTSGPKRVFVTKLTYSASAVSDQICQNAADAVSLGGTWKAWLSYQYEVGKNKNAIDRITGTGPWKLLTGEVVFQNHAQLSTTPSVPIQVTESGTKLGVSELVFTGTTTGGVTSNEDCSEWSSTSSGYTVTLGLCSASDTRWSADASQPCNFGAHLYCFEL